jgi:hypothetical protein
MKKKNSNLYLTGVEIRLQNIENATLHNDVQPPHTSTNIGKVKLFDIVQNSSAYFISKGHVCRH